MDQLKAAVAEAFDNVVASGAIESAIQEQIAKSITGAIKEQIGGYNSDFSKKINAKIGALIDVNLDEIDLPSYRQLIADIIKQRVGAVMTMEFTEKLDKDIGDLLSPAPAEITLEALLAEFVETKKEAYNAHELRGNSFTLIIDRDKSQSLRDSGYIDVYIDEDQRHEQYGCAIHLRIRGNGEVWGLTIGGDDIKNKIFVGPLFNFEKRLFQMYTAKTRLIIPADATADDFETRFPDGSDY